MAYINGKEILFSTTILSIPEEYIVPSGTMSITANGTYNVTEKAEIYVNVPPSEGYIVPSGRVEINSNGVYYVADKEEVLISVPDSPLPVDVSTEAEMNELLNTAPTGAIYRYMGTTGIYENGELYVVEAV